MNSHTKVFIFFLIISLSKCINEEFIEIGTLEKTMFDINKNQKAYFKYKLGREKGPIGLHFHLANLYTVKVEIYNNSADEQPILSYFLAEEQFKEIDTENFNEYLYIVISETYEYFYKDYITIYNPNEIIVLKPDKTLTINNFLSNNKYEISFTSNNTMLLFYNTFNLENNKRKITVKHNDEIIYQGEESLYNSEFLPGTLNIIVENLVNKETEDQIGNQDFSLIVYEKKNKFGFKEILKNEISHIDYIYNNQNQEFYFYIDISDYTRSNTLNFKLNFKYYLFKNNTNFFTKMIYLDEPIKDIDLEKEGNITENDCPSSYDIDSDEYFRIYFKNTNIDKKYKYLLVKLEIIENEYFVGSKNIETSLGEEIKEHDLNEIDYNIAYDITNKIINYIPTYFKLLLNPDDKYILTSQYSDLSLFIKGDLLNEQNEINEDYFISNNEIIILSGIKELTVKLFGSASNELIFYVERMNSSDFNFAENKRNNEVFQIEMTEKECNNGDTKYILGNYDYETYAYGSGKVTYYLAIDSGDFSVFFKNNIQFEKGKSLFPLNESQSIEFNKEIILKTNLDFFTIKCKKGGIMSIRPKTKTFEETTHLIEQNTINQIKLYDYVEIIQLTTLLGQTEGTLYFSILSLDGEKTIITPDTPKVFKEQTIQNNELFTASINLSKFRMDQLAVKVNCSSLEKNLEIVEIIHNKNNTYQELKKGENKNIKINNVYFKIDNDIDKFNITLENLQNKTLAYGIIQSASKDENYLATAEKYPNITIIEQLLYEKLDLEIENIYYKNIDNMKPYLFLLISVLEEDNNLNYNIKIDIKDSDEDDDDDSMVFYVVIALVSAIILGFIILGLFMCVIKKKTQKDEDKLEKLNSADMYNMNNNEIDP